MVYKLVPWFLLVHSKDVIIVTVKGHVIFLNIVEKVICSKNLGNLNKLIVVVFSLEERLFLKDHTGKHTAKRPNIQRVIVGLQVNKQLWTLEVS